MYFARCSGVRREPQVAREAAGGRAGVHPRQLKRDERQHQIFRAGDEPALFRIQKRGGDAAFVVVLEQAVFLRRPFVRIAPAGGDKPGDRPARHAARRLHQHVEFVAVGEAPHHLADVVTGEGGQHRRSFFHGHCFHKTSFCGGRFHGHRTYPPISTT
jgi:hypothetical protein